MSMDAEPRFMLQLKVILHNTNYTKLQKVFLVCLSTISYTFKIYFCL